MKKELLKLIRFLLYTKGIKTNPIEIGIQLRKKYFEDIALLNIKLEEFFKKEEEINILNFPTSNRLLLLDCLLLFDFKIAGDENTSNVKLLAAFFEYIK